MVFLGGLARLIKSRFGNVTFNWNTLQNNIFTNLGQNGFWLLLNTEATLDRKLNPYREDKVLDKNSMMDYLKVKWLRQGWVHVSELLQNAIAGSVWEIYTNAFEHAQSPIGVFSCGQHYPRRKELQLTVADFGVGIPSTVRLFFSNDQRAHSLSAANCLKWAFQPGTTTKPNGTSRGMGLDLLKEFVKINKGKLEIFSHEGYALIDETQEIFMNRQTF